MRASPRAAALNPQGPPAHTEPCPQPAPVAAHRARRDAFCLPVSMRCVPSAERGGSSDALISAVRSRSSAACRPSSTAITFLLPAGGCARRDDVSADACARARGTLRRTLQQALGVNVALLGVLVAPRVDACEQRLELRALLRAVLRLALPETAARGWEIRW